ncbi:enterochelin esterase domain-containing protein [Vibrio chagasii]
MIESQGAPLVEYQLNNKAFVTFLFRGNANNVRLLGAPYGGHAQMSKIEGSDIWFRSFEVPDSTRLSYRIAPNVPQLARDTNRETTQSSIGDCSTRPIKFGAQLWL